MMGYSAVSASGNFSDSGDLYLWSGGGGEKRFARKKNWAGHEGSATSCAASADGQTLVTGGMEGIVKVWSVGTWEGQASVHEDSSAKSRGVHSVAISHDGKTVAAGCDRSIHFFDTETSENSRSLIRAHTGEARSISFSPDGKTLASIGGDMAIKLWDVRKTVLVNELEGHEKMPTGVVFAPDGHVYSCSEDGTVRVWDAKKGKKVRAWRAHQTGSVKHLAISANGKVLATAGSDKTVRVWEAETGTEVCTLVGHRGEVNVVAVSKDGAMVASGGDDNMVKMWTIEGRGDQTMTGHSDVVKGLAFLPPIQPLTN